MKTKREKQIVISPNRPRLTISNNGKIGAECNKTLKHRQIKKIEEEEQSSTKEKAVDVSQLNTLNGERQTEPIKQADTAPERCSYTFCRPRGPRHSSAVMSRP